MGQESDKPHWAPRTTLIGMMCGREWFAVVLSERARRGREYDWSGREKNLGIGVEKLTYKQLGSLLVKYKRHGPRSREGRISALNTIFTRRIFEIRSIFFSGLTISSVILSKKKIQRRQTPIYKPIVQPKEYLEVLRGVQWRGCWRGFLPIQAYYGRRSRTITRSSRC